MNRNRAIPKLFFPLGLFVGMLMALLLSLSIVIINLNPPADDIKLLFLFMFGSGSFSVVAVYVLYRIGLLERFTSLRWALLVSIVLLVVLIVLNVWLTAQLMYISEHDFILTIALLIFAGVVSAVCVFFIANVWIERIAILGAAARRLQSGDLKSRLDVRGNDELAQLARAFNTMVDGLQALEAQKRDLEQTRRDLVAWVSHDLRTPLASIRAMHESILDGVVSDPGTINRYIHAIQGELYHLSKMIDDLFELAQLDAGSFRLRHESASLRDLISDTLGGMGAAAVRMGIQLQGEVEPGLDMVVMAPDKIQRVLHNLCDNALRYTPAGGRVSLTARRVPGAVEVSVHNSGSVIPAADIPFVFESFYRGDPSRVSSGATRGTGLGLAIVRAFVEAHGGRISVTSTAETGTQFIFTLPHP